MDGGMYIIFFLFAESNDRAVDSAMYTLYSSQEYVLMLRGPTKVHHQCQDRVAAHAPHCFNPRMPQVWDEFDRSIVRSCPLAAEYDITASLGGARLASLHPFLSQETMLFVWRKCGWFDGAFRRDIDMLVQSIESMLVHSALLAMEREETEMAVWRSTCPPTAPLW